MDVACVKAVKVKAVVQLEIGENTERIMKTRMCTATGCLTSSRQEGTKFFNFPRNPARALVWAGKVGISCTIDSAGKLHNKFLCSRHFSANDFTTAERVHLNRVAVPCGSDFASQSSPQPAESTRPKDDSDSDSAPENISFSAGRKLVVESLKTAADSIQMEERRRKEKRKQRLEMYKRQKEEKLLRLKEKKASQEDASCSSSEESSYEEQDVPYACERSNSKRGVKPQKENLRDLAHSRVRRFHSGHEAELQKRKGRTRRLEQKARTQGLGNLKKLPSDVLEHLPDRIPVKLPNVEREAASEERSQEKHDKSGDVKGKRKSSDFRYRSDVDCIAVSTCGATEFGVMPLDKLMRAPQSMAQRAAEFRQKMLFGDRIRRAQANAQIICQQKLKASGKGRLVR